jgi:uncharacterized protein
MASPFLTAEWRKLVMANYIVEPSLLQPFVPNKTEIDLWNGKCYVSLVGFMFINTRIKGVKIPFHVNFEEINLRFYVKQGDRRGVVFIKEIVGKSAVSFIANTIYKENYETLPVSHSWIVTPSTMNVEYRWKKNDWNVFRVSTEKKPVRIAEGSEEDFITNKYWGFTKTREYEVQHAHWDMYPVRSFRLDVDFGSVYGERFGFLSKEKPHSVILAEGSSIAVLPSKNI